MVVAGGVVGAGYALSCGSGDSSEKDMISSFRADPIFAAVPPYGTLAKESSQLGACDPAGEEAPGERTTLVSRIYTTPAIYGFDQLRQVFDQPAMAGGWKLETDIGDHQAAQGTSFFSVATYCRQAGGKVLRAVAESPPQGMGTTTGVQVTILHYGDAPPCGQLEHHVGERSTPAPSCPTETDGMRRTGSPAC